MKTRKIVATAFLAAWMVVVTILLAVVCGLAHGHGPEAPSPPVACAERVTRSPGSGVTTCDPGQRVEVLRGREGEVAGWVCRCTAVGGVDGGVL